MKCSEMYCQGNVVILFQSIIFVLDDSIEVFVCDKGIVKSKIE